MSNSPFVRDLGGKMAGFADSGSNLMLCAFEFAPGHLPECEMSASQSNNWWEQKDEQLRKEWVRTDCFLLQAGTPSEESAAQRSGKKHTRFEGSGTAYQQLVMLAVDDPAVGKGRWQNRQLWILVSWEKNNAPENGLRFSPVFSRVVKPSWLL